MRGSPVVRMRHLIAIDMGAMALSFVLAVLLRFDTTSVIGANLHKYGSLLCLSFLIRFPVYLLFGLYERLWRYASIPEVLRIGLASLSSVILIYFVNFIILPVATLPISTSYSIFVIDGLLNLLLLGGSRFWYRVVWDWQRRPKAPAFTEVVERRSRTLILGAGDVGEAIVRQAKDNSELGLEVVAFLDENPAMHGMRIHGVPILGDYSQLPQVIRGRDIDQVIITDRKSAADHTRAIEDWCHSFYIPTKSVLTLHELFGGIVDDGLMAGRLGVPQPPPAYHNLLVAGGAGFIGANFVHYMLEAHSDYRIVIYDKLTYAGNTENVLGLAQEYGERYAFVRGDICDPRMVERTLKQYQIDVIVNFAAETHVDRSLMTPGDFACTNVLGTHVLLQQARQFGIQRYHQISTDEVYGQILQGSFKETDPIDCRSPYSASKAGGDVMCLAYFTSFGLPITISRGSNNIGPYQHVEKAVPLFVTNALDDLPLPVYGDGKYERDYQYVQDHCEGIDTILHRGKPGEVYNLGSGREMAAVDVAMKICDLLGKPHSLILFVEDRPGQDRRYSLDCTKTLRLGWRPKHTTEQALEKTVHWYVANEWWWRKVKQGEYKQYYEVQYGERLKHAVCVLPSPAETTAGVG